MAVPAAVSWVVPIKWMSVQMLAEASQKFTWPTVTALAPAFTVAVSATTLPVGTVVTAPAPEVTANVVTVGGSVAAQTLWHVALTAAISERYRNARAQFSDCRMDTRCLGHGAATQGKFIAGLDSSHRERSIAVWSLRDVIPRGRDRPHRYPMW